MDFLELKKHKKNKITTLYTTILHLIYFYNFFTTRTSLSELVLRKRKMAFRFGSVLTSLGKILLKPKFHEKDRTIRLKD